jgi:hypothetical protein
MQSSILIIVNLKLTKSTVVHIQRKRKINTAILMYAILIPDLIVKEKTIAVLKEILMICLICLNSHVTSYVLSLISAFLEMFVKLLDFI